MGMISEQVIPFPFHSDSHGLQVLYKEVYSPYIGSDYALRPTLTHSIKYDLSWATLMHQCGFACMLWESSYISIFSLLLQVNQPFCLFVCLLLLLLFLGGFFFGGGCFLSLFFKICLSKLNSLQMRDNQCFVKDKFPVFSYISVMSLPNSTHKDTSQVCYWMT